MGADQTNKVSLPDMIHWAEREKERVEIWKRVLRSEGDEMDPEVARNGLIAGKIAETLELVLLHHKEFTAMVVERRRAIASASTESSSEKSTDDTRLPANGAR